MNPLREINRIYAEKKPMTEKQLALLHALQERVRRKELTVQQCREIWAKEVKV